MHRALSLLAALGACAAAAPLYAQQVTWGALSPAADPGPLADFAYASAPGGGFLFGGLGPAPTSLQFPELWQFDGNNWTLVPALPAPGPVPGPRIGAAMVFDSMRGRLVLFGGFGISDLSMPTPSAFLNDTWAFDFATTTWTLLTPAGAIGAPAPRTDHAMAYDAARDQVVLFGGSNGPTLSDTAEFNGTVWAPVTPGGTPPTARFDAAMVFDPTRGVCVLFGGTDNQGFTTLPNVAEYDGTMWTDIAAAGPAVRAGTAMAFDPVRARTVVFGGNFETPAGNGLLNDSWEWDGMTWVPDPLTGQPSARSSGGLFFIATQQRSIAFGGRSTAFNVFSDTAFRTSDFEPLFVPSTPSCAGLGGVPTLGVGLFPWVGDTFTVVLTGVQTGVLPVLHFDPWNWSTGSPTRLSVDLGLIGAPGCLLMTSSTISVPAPGPTVAGSLTWTIPIPVDPLWISRDVVLQSLVPDPGANLLGITTTGAVSARIGAR
ncbi:MAG: kelch repeat-containing protein [Planctomycetota bacterium]